MIDYHEIFDKLEIDTVKNLLTQLEIEFIDRGEFLICRTLCHNLEPEEASYKLYYYHNTRSFVCYTECGTMSIFKFLKQYYELRDIEYNWYTDIFLPIAGQATRNIENFSIKKYISNRNKYEYARPQQLEEYNKGVLDCFIKFYPTEWLNDGITKAAMDKFNIKYSISQNKIIIPHYDVNDRLIGIRGRALDKWEIENIGKYAPIKMGNIWYKHPLSLNLYGLNFNKENIKKYRYCLIGESEKFVLQLEGFNRPNCGVAVCGSNLNKYLIKLLIKECGPKEIIICFDKEEKPQQDKYFNKLYQLGSKYKQYVNISFIYDRENLLQLKDSPTDRGQEVFEKLLQKRVCIR